MFESAQKVWNLYFCPFKPSLGSQDTEVSPCKTHKKCVSENVNGTENPFPTQTAISAYAMSRVLKEGRKKMFFCSLGLGFGPFNFPQFPSKVHQFRRGFHQIQWIIPDAGSLNRSKSIGFKGNFAGNREIQCDFFVCRNCFTMSCTFVVSVNQTLPGSQWDSRPGAPNPSPRQMWPLIGVNWLKAKAIYNVSKAIVNRPPNSP